jgi:hypothetical protein
MLVMNSQVAITVSGHVFAYPKVVSVPPRDAAQDAIRTAAGTAVEPIWPIEFAAAA